MAKHFGRCSRELECLRHFQTRDCLYKAWSCSQREASEIRDRTSESIGERAREEKTCAVYEPVSSTVTAIAILNPQSAYSKLRDRDPPWNCVKLLGQISTLSSPSAALL